MEIHTIGIDLGKTVFHLVGLNARGEVVVRKKCSRDQILRFTANLQVSLIGMEACGGAHFLARALREQGHDARLMPAKYVKPYVKTNKNDYIDAEAIAEAVGRARMRFVPIKTDDQLDLQSLHRVRERWVSGRTAVINQMRVLLTELRQEMQYLQRQVDECDKLILRIADELEDCRRMVAVPGIGPMIATATIAAIGNGSAFKKGRGFAAWLGVVPGQHSTGGKQTLTDTKRRGNRYLRKLFVQGAHAVLQQRMKQSNGLNTWLAQLTFRKRIQVAAVALANKMARMVWAVLSKGEAYRPPLLIETAV
jgi:transposase